MDKPIIACLIALLIMVSYQILHSDLKKTNKKLAYIAKEIKSCTMITK